MVCILNLKLTQLQLINMIFLLARKVDDNLYYECNFTVSYVIKQNYPKITLIRTQTLARTRSTRQSNIVVCSIDNKQGKICDKSKTAMLTNYSV